VNIKAVFFDYDDTLIDAHSARNHARRTVATRVAQNHGLNEALVLEAIKNVEARMEASGIFDRRIWFREMANSLGIMLSLGEINELVRIYWDSWSLRSKVFPDVIPTLKALKKCGYVIGLITNTDGELGLKRNRINRDGILNLFDVVIIAGDDTEQVKPSPQPFLEALKIVNIKGNEAIYVGDKPGSDIPGAKAAGMYTVLIDRYGLLVPDLINPKPDYIIKSLLDLSRLLRHCGDNAY
jgi:haloacid dehalogenase superfamily, subfamily IA, variant 1 with third motif having Dx(3-4)D or Dx(3-4)E